MELNREQIIKSLECCELGDCYPCIYRMTESGVCQDMLCKEALELIKELTEENESLSQSLANSKSILANSKADTVRKMQERLREDLRGFVDVDYLERLLTIYEKKYTEGK